MHTMDMGDILPPTRPPPLMTRSQLDYLAFQGHLPIELPLHLIQQGVNLTKESAGFFQLPTKEKKAAYPAAYGTELGYYIVPGEKEYITLRHGAQVTPNFAGVVSNLEASAESYWQQVAALLHRILADLAEYVGGHPDEWKPVLDGQGTHNLPPNWDQAGPSLLRLFKYEPSTGVAEPHTDLGLLTLCVGSGQGLQLWERFDSAVSQQNSTTSPDAGQWIDAEGPTVLIGSFASAMTNCKLQAGLHRVVANPQGRTSLVFALRPSLQHPEAKTLYKTIEHNKYNINAQKHIREKQRLSRLARLKAAQDEAYQPET